VPLMSFWLLTPMEALASVPITRISRPQAWKQR